MTDLDLDDLEKITNEATPWPWCYATVHRLTDSGQTLPTHMQTDCGDICVNTPPWTPVFRKHGFARDEDTWFVVAMRRDAKALIAAARDNEEHRARSVLLDEAQADNARLVRMLSERDAALAAVKARVEALETALEHFADGANECPDHYSGDCAAWNVPELQEWLKDTGVIDFRRARAALKHKDGMGATEMPIS